MARRDEARREVETLNARNVELMTLLTTRNAECDELRNGRGVRAALDAARVEVNGWWMRLLAGTARPDPAGGEFTARALEVVAFHDAQVKREALGPVFQRGLEKLREVAARAGDDLCWRAGDEILEAFGFPVTGRRALPRGEFLENCARYHDALRLGTTYETEIPMRERLAALERLLEGLKGRGLVVDHPTVSNAWSVTVR